MTSQNPHRAKRHDLERFRLESDNYVAEIVCRKEQTHPIYYWIVQRKDSNEIITCGSAVDYAGAEECANAALADLEDENGAFAAAKAV